MKIFNYIVFTVIGFILLGCASTSTLIINITELDYPSDMNVVSPDNQCYQDKKTNQRKGIRY
ncbi:MAG: hypothetical protein R6W68_00255 [Ignavibacteriaceae bacterium]